MIFNTATRTSVGVDGSRPTSVILSEAKDLSRWAARCFAALSMTRLDRILHQHVKE